MANYCYSLLICIKALSMPPCQCAGAFTASLVVKNCTEQEVLRPPEKNLLGHVFWIDRCINLILASPPLSVRYGNKSNFQLMSVVCVVGRELSADCITKLSF